MCYNSRLELGTCSPETLFIKFTTLFLAHWNTSLSYGYAFFFNLLFTSQEWKLMIYLHFFMHGLVSCKISLFKINGSQQILNRKYIKIFISLGTFSSFSIEGPVFHLIDDCEHPLLYLPGTGIALPETAV